MSDVEAWLRGPVAGVAAHLMPAAHALVQTLEEVERAVGSLSTDELWVKPGGAASIGFHLRHIAGATDRLLTYARGEALSAEQLAWLKTEGERDEGPATAEELLGQVRRTIDLALRQLRNTAPETLLEARGVGRRKLPSNVLGLIFHAAEHAQRHTGQIVATVKVVKARAV